MSTQSTASRGAILAAFKELVIAQSYDTVYIPDIIDRSNVSRSTFYNHFNSKDDLLRESLAYLMDVLSLAGSSSNIPKGLLGILEHFQHDRDVVLAFLNAGVFRISVELLAHRIQNRIDEGTEANTLRLPSRLIAAQVAESTFGLIRAWLTDDCEVAPKVIAARIHDSAKALTQTI